MNNQSALFIAIVVLAGFAVDAVVLEGQISLYLARQWLALLSWLAIWR